MRKIAILPLAAVITMAFTACSSAPKMFWGMDEGKKGESATQQTVQTKVRPALEIPPELRGKVEVPASDQIASTDKVPKYYSKAVAGTRVSLDAKVYKEPVGRVFSAVIDAMTALNLPVASVDSPSGTLTTDWVRTDVNNANDNSFIKGMNVFGNGARAFRYRHTVRVLRLQAKDGDTSKMTRLEIRTMGQAFIGSHWVNKKFKRKYAKELFARVEERLAPATH
ncbi:MAG: hypothetical protein Q9M22_06685 [Mariprofundaceae bacterium]|nr:hypothetical protein [Mariprofundaceae bacterium]